MEAARPQILADLSALADGTRARLLLLLDEHELTVTELCEVLDLPQSTVSRHLKTLADGGWVRSRPEGPRRLYRLDAEALPEASHRLWSLMRAEAAPVGSASGDPKRLEAVLRARRARSAAFFAGAADDWDRLRDELFGGSLLGLTLPGLLPPDAVVGDLGCGTGAVAAALAPFVGRVIAVDESAAMLDAARARLGDRPDVELRRGRLERLPLEDGSVDLATLVLVLHHVADPGAALGEAARALRAGGRLLVVDLLPHERTELQRQMGHVWLGFDEKRLADWVRAAGLVPARHVRLPPAASARGPALFALTAERPASRASARSIGNRKRSHKRTKERRR